MTQPTRKLLDTMAMLRNEHGSASAIIKACMELWPESVVGVLNDALADSRQKIEYMRRMTDIPADDTEVSEPVRDVTDMETLARNQDDDAAKWADSFIWRIKNGMDPTDFGWMAGVFANAMGAAEAQGRKRALRDDPVSSFVAGAKMEYDQQNAEAPMHSKDVYYAEDLGPEPFILTFTLDQPAASVTARRLCGPYGVFRNAINLFLKRNAEYGDESNVLGYKGQYADINRKMIKLKRYLWDDEPVPDGAESPSTIAMELIGHLALLVDARERDFEDGLKEDGR